ncbi:MAG TPA: response regulator transcription factor [Actinomycetospora sp.]|jgi:DNA-binding NarL/FixJ family response regulator|uniref:response regulator n=1 Tax=Actinomycetospora sp. TaxID=1872135 RepID=UPI002F3F17DF
MDEESAGGPGTATITRPARVVLVEDHPAVREQLTALLRAAGLDVVAVAGDLRGGHDAVRTARPEVAVVDNRLPDGRGIDLCALLAREAPEVALIVHSGAVTDAETERALALGVAAVVPKSLRGSELLAAVRHAAGRSRP